MFDGQWHPVFDPGVLETIVDGTPEAIGILLTILTHMGSVYVVVPVVALFYLWAPQRGVAWIAAVCGYYGLMGGIKSLNSANRPALESSVSGEWFPGPLYWLHDHGAGIDTTSFPSGNAMIATTIITLMILDLRVSTLRNRALVGGFVIAVVGYSRVALAVHYPIDVIGGILLGLLLAGIVVTARNHAGVLGVFGAMALLALIGLWVRSNGFGVPVWDGLSGSNRNLAFGGALGGLLMWWRGTTTDWKLAGERAGQWTVSVGILAVMVGTYAVHSVISHPLMTMFWAAVIFGSLIATPFVLPDRQTVNRSLGVASDQKTK